MSGLRRFVKRAASAAAPAGPGIPPIQDILAERGARSERDAGAAADAERCEMCREVLDDRHGHVVDTEKRSLVCACRACYLLFTQEGAAGGRYRSVPEHVYHDPGRPLTDADWNELQIPVAMAFFFFNSALGRVVAGYPSPGGATECELDLAAWDRLAAAYPLLGALAPDVEAIFVNRVYPGGTTPPGPPVRGDPSPRAPLGGDPSSPDPLRGDPSSPDPLRGDPSSPDPLRGDSSPRTPLGGDPSSPDPLRGDSSPRTPLEPLPTPGNFEVFLIPIDECYSLVGELRLLWQGFDGGAEARAARATFLDSLRRRALVLEGS